MNMIPINLILSVLFVVGMIAVVLFVQIKLSQSKNKYLGLILPVISFLYSLLIVLGIAAFTVTTDSLIVSEVDEQSGEIIKESEEIIEVTIADSKDSTFLGIGYIFLVTNIPTVVLGGMYVSERNKITTRREIEKMKIDDL